jgi:hypothetical protein
MNDQGPLARRSVPCPMCGGAGKVTKYRLRFPRSLPIYAYEADCEVCKGFKTMPEPAEEWAERCAAIALKLSEREWCSEYCVAWEICPGENEHPDCDALRLTAAARAVAEKESI